MNVEINPDFDSTKLDEFGLEVLNSIKAHYPEWLPFISNDKSWGDRFEINIPSPHPDIPALWISTAVGEFDIDEIEVGFGFPPINTALHHKECYTVEQKVAKINSYVTAIKSEELIYADFVKDRLSSGAGLITNERLKELLKEGRVRIAYSWKGTYNYKQKVSAKRQSKNWFSYHSFTSLIIPLNILILIGLASVGLITTIPNFQNTELWGNEYITKKLFNIEWYVHTALPDYFFCLIPLFLISTALENLLKPAAIFIVYLICLLITALLSFLFNPIGLTYFPYEILIMGSTISAIFGLYGFSFAFFSSVEKPNGCGLRFLRQVSGIIYFVYILLQPEFSKYWSITGIIIGALIGFYTSKLTSMEREDKILSDLVSPEHSLIK